MEVAEKMMIQEPTLKIIHHYRDPRAVALSRRIDPSLHGLYKGQYNLTHEASLYCIHLRNDIIKGQELKRKFPGRIFDSLFESTVQRPRLFISQMFSFLGLNMPSELKTWLQTGTRSDYKSLTLAWVQQVSPEVRMSIDRVCHELYELLDFPWPTTFNDTSPNV
jgi:hypothetical protein